MNSRRPQSRRLTLTLEHIWGRLFDLRHRLLFNFDLLLEPSVLPGFAEFDHITFLFIGKLHPMKPLFSTAKATAAKTIFTVLADPLTGTRDVEQL